MQDDAKQTKYLKDYQKSAYEIEAVHLTFELLDTHTIVTSVLRVIPQASHSGDLELQGDELTLLSVTLEGQILEPSRYEHSADSLRIFNVPLTAFELTIQTQIVPEKNTALSGLYYTNGNYCTQCEPEGFRRITYYLDRPDILAIFTTTIMADKEKFPHLLSNGNLLTTGEEGGTHWATWFDPFPKPCYLFALVAGQFACLEDSFTTRSGRAVKIAFYVEPAQKHKVAHAIESLKKAMKWDEETYGLEYDLDIYMVVAVSDFNMGAMENKGLNVFNTKYVLADEQTATDTDYLNIEAVIGHEYFHNWTGNRVTCRDWFQLSLKEGLTVFREHQFSAFCGSPAVQRIDETNTIRTRQFAEDSSPLSHPIRPDAYVEMNNFYTVTVYQKGAEVIRMLQTLVGEAGFYKGVSLYFERHDGQAVTCEDFVQAISDANQMDLKLFQHWYSQAGTPHVSVKGEYDAAKKCFTLHCEQSGGKHPFVIPIKLALLKPNGSISDEQVVILSSMQQSFVFQNISEKPIPSLFRGFSAPVHYQYPYTLADRLHLLHHDTDSLNQWDAVQQLVTDYLMGTHPDITQEVICDSLQGLLKDTVKDEAFLARLLTFPTLSYLVNLKTPVDIEGLPLRRRQLEVALAQKAESTFLERYRMTADTAQKRALKNTCLYYLLRANAHHQELAQEQYDFASNMTLKLGALQAINDLELPLRNDLLDRFYQEFQHDALVLDKWFALQARADRKTVQKEVQHLMKHAAFQIKNPNKVYALIGGFTANLPAFHEKEGSGYTFIQNVVLELDVINPQVAARIVGAFSDKHQYDLGRQQKINDCLTYLLAQKLSPDVYEIVKKSLG